MPKERYWNQRNYYRKSSWNGYGNQQKRHHSRSESKHRQSKNERVYLEYESKMNDRANPSHNSEKDKNLKTCKYQQERIDLEATLKKLRAEARALEKEERKQEEIVKEQKYIAELQQEKERLIQILKNQGKQTIHETQSWNAAHGQETHGFSEEEINEDSEDFGLGPTGGPLLLDE